MSGCVSGKKAFENRHLAEEALIEHMIRFNHTAGRGPVNIYECEDCGLFHFTSKGNPHPILEQKRDYIKRQQDARDWENRLR